jgi:2-C-methyl-D-erythritol 4-phosphate cytidylyltransferase
MPGTFAVILPAAGRSLRFGGGGRDKLLEPLGGQPVIARSVQAFLQRADVGLVIIPTNQRERIEPVVDPRVQFCPGGPSRAESVLNALREIPERFEWVAVHDAARPLVSQRLIDRTFAAARQHGAAVPALPIALTVKQAAGPLPARVERTVPRKNLWAMQTPQVMRRDELLAAYAKCPIPLSDVTDDTQLLELAGREVWLVEGEERNLKITTPADLRVAELWLDQGVRQLWPLLFIQDIARSVTFYRDRLGFTLAQQAESNGKLFWCRLERGGASIMLQQVQDTEDGPPQARGRGVAFYFVCDDADAVYEEFTSRGLTLKPPEIAYYGMKQLFVPEPDGYTICFESPVPGR